MTPPDDPTQRAVRQATFYARLFAAAAVIVAFAGSALVARFALGHLPFLQAWLLVLGTVGTGVLLIVGVRVWVERTRRGPGHRRDDDRLMDSDGER
ncbi:MAG TPA: hypothetical protein VMN78_10675 [Longimicrobiales bacterium]|nr:hypothetical protein [Longimicrobiales bacterium]